MICDVSGGIMSNWAKGKATMRLERGKEGSVVVVDGV